jgi:serine acetyltransferase/glycosyltransferase involved in cell wall biosynthesis
MKIHFYWKIFPAAGEPLLDGTSRAVHGLASGLASLGQDVTVVCEGQENSLRQSRNGYAIRCLAHPGRVARAGSLRFATAPGLREFLATNRPDLALLNGFFNPHVYAYSRVFIEHHIPYVSVPHNPYDSRVFGRKPLLKWPYWYLFERRVLKHARAVQWLDERQAKQPLGLRTQPIVAPNGFADEQVPPEENLEFRTEGPIQILFFGRLDIYHKGIDILIEAFSRFSQSYDARFTLQGPDWRHERGAIESLLQERNVQHAEVREPNFTQAAPELIAEHDVMCMPSRFEGFGLSALEAMLAARVLLVGESAGIAAHIEKSGCGVLVKPTVDSVYAGLCDLAKRRASWKEMGLKGRAHALQNLHWNKIARDLLPQYQEAARRERRQSSRRMMQDPQTGTSLKRKNDAMNLPSNVIRRLFCFLHDEGVRYCVIGEDCAARDEVRIAVENSALPRLGGRLTRFARSEGMLLIRYSQTHASGCEGTFAWVADGETRYLRFEITGDTYVGGVCIWRARELLSECLAALDSSGKPRGYFVPPPAADFLYIFLNSLNDGQLDSEGMEQASLRFSEDPAGARVGLERHFGAVEVARILETMESNDWEALRELLPRLKGRLAVRGLPRRLLTKLRSALFRPRGMLVACIGPQGSGRAIVIERVKASLAPAFALHSARSQPEVLVNHLAANSPRRTLLAGKRVRRFVRDYAALMAMKFRTRFLGQTIVTSRGFQSNTWSGVESGVRLVPQPDLWIVLDAPPEQLQARKPDVSHADSLRERDECLSWVAAKQNAIVLNAGQPLERVAAEAVAAILELASQRAGARAAFSTVEVNRFNAKLLLFCCRHRIPFLSGFVRTLFNSEIDCPIHFPVRLPYPFGIVIHANAQIGSGVTIMQQVTIGVKALDDTAAPMIEDDVIIGAGAKVLGAIKVGRGAVIGANAVVTRNVPKLATVAGVNHILHAPSPPPGEQTLRLIESLKPAETLDLTMAPAERRKANHDV